MLDTSTDITLQTKLCFRKTISSQPVKANTLGQLILINPKEDPSQQYDWLDVKAFELSCNNKQPKEGILILENTPMFNVLEKRLEEESKQSKLKEKTKQSILESVKSFFLKKQPPIVSITIKDLLDEVLKATSLDEVLKATSLDEALEIIRTFDKHNTLGPEIQIYLDNQSSNPRPEQQALLPAEETTAAAETPRDRRPEQIEEIPAPTTTPVSFWECIRNRLACCGVVK